MVSLTDVTPEQKLANALDGVMRSDTMWAVPLAGAEYMSAPGCGTMGVAVRYVNQERYVRVKYDPAYVQEQPLWVVEFTLVHEILHVELKHHTRRDGRNFDEWNEAGDYEIHGIMRKMGRQIPSFALYDPAYDGLDIVQIYNLRHGKQESDEGEESEDKKQDSQDNDQSKDENKSSDSSNEASDDTSDNKSTSDQSSSDNAENDQENDCDSDQSGEDGQSSDGQPSKSSSKPKRYIGEVEDMETDGSAPSEEDIAGEEQQVEIDIQQAVQLARRAGHLPANMEKLVKYIGKPNVDWRAALASWLNQISKADYSWSRPSRRYASLGIPMPSLHRFELGKIGIFLDTSGSVFCRTKMVEEIVAEVQSMFETFKISSALFLPCDTRVIEQAIQEIGPNDELDLSKIRGGGGTDFRPPFAYVDQQDEKIVGAIYLTDGECWTLPEEPDYPVIWFIAKGGMHNFHPPFGEVITYKS